jgi:hypothetical protein
MRVQAEQTKKFKVDAPCGAEDGRQDADRVIVSIFGARQLHLRLGGMLQRRVDVLRMRDSGPAIIGRRSSPEPRRHAGHAEGSL